MGSQAASKHSAVSLLTWHARLKPPPPSVLLSSFQGAQATDECLSQLWVIFPGLDKLNSALLSLYITLISCSCSRFAHASACSRAKRGISHFSIFRCCSCSTLINPVSQTRIIVRAWDFPFLSSNLAVTVQTESSPLRNISHRSAVLMYHRLTVTFFLVILVPGGRCV